jgi:hypothetical protein
MMVEKRRARIPDWKWSSVSARYGRRLPVEDTGEWKRQEDEPPVEFLWDHGTAVHISDRFSPKYERRVAPFCQGLFELSDERDGDNQPLEKYSCGCLIYAPKLGSLGPLQMVLSGAYSTGAFTDMDNLIQSCQQAVDGLIPIIAWVGSNEHTVKSGKARGKIYHSPRWEIVNWMERPSFFGERLNAMPTARPAIESSITMPVRTETGEIAMIEVRDEIPF